MDTKIFPFMILLLLAVSCVKQDHNNPFDLQCPKELWTPTDFKATLEGATVKLTWSQTEDRISGFKLTKKVDTGTESTFPSQSKDANQLTDASPTGGKVHVYTLVAYAGNNQSNIVTAQITPVFTATVTTTSGSSITAYSLVMGGSITSDGGSPVFERGVCWGTTSNPLTTTNKVPIGSGTGAFSTTISGLSPSTTYYFRAYAVNNLGTAYGNDVTVTMLSALPTLTTTTVSAITTTTATSGGNITYEGVSTVTSHGVCWSTTLNPTTANSKTTDGSGSGTFTSSLTGLTPGTQYYVRAYATNGTGTGYGVQVNFTTSPKFGGTITDIDGNVYNTVTIGTQVWMVENLKTTKYRNGDMIDNNAIWAASGTGSYCWYNNDGATYKATYGALYNWYAVADSRNIAPVGWHVATDAEWTTLTTFLGGESVAGGKLKETGTSHWLSQNTGTTNSSGFTAFPGGLRYSNGSFNAVGYLGYWWTSTEFSTTNVWFRYMDSSYSFAYGGYDSKYFGFSVRCLQD